jgi:[protein-PII] uridylyltransferase
MKVETVARSALISRLKTRLRDGQRLIRERFLAGGDATRLLHERCQLVDEVLCELWSDLALPASLALIAVGGYGRGELYPASDVDLLILLPEQADDVLTTRIEQLICVFWDVGLETGHSVRTIEQCLEEAAGDITVQTAMIEARLLVGSGSLFQGLSSLIRGSLDAQAFFQSKRIQQEDRHQRFSDTPYSLEANCKEGPGGLRDLQLILWIAQAAGYGKCWKDLEQRGFITDEEGRASQRLRGLSCACCARTCTCTPDAEKIACSSSTRRPWPNNSVSPPQPRAAPASN